MESWSTLDVARSRPLLSFYRTTRPERLTAHASVYHMTHRDPDVTMTSHNDVWKGSVSVNGCPRNVWRRRRMVVREQRKGELFQTIIQWKKVRSHLDNLFKKVSSRITMCRRLSLCLLCNPELVGQRGRLLLVKAHVLWSESGGDWRRAFLCSSEAGSHYIYTYILTLPIHLEIK